MSHELEIVNGKASFFTNTVPAWHNLGTIVDGARTWAEAVELANMNWKVEKRPLFGQVGNEFNKVDAFGIFRADNNAFLGAVGDRYTPVQNQFIFEFMDEVLGAGGAHYETAGVLGNGNRIFVLANLEQEHDILGSGDKHASYLGGYAAHDGSSSVRFVVTDVRWVCNNTVTMGLNKAKGTGVSVKHTTNAETRIKANLQLLQNARTQFASTMELLEVLAKRKVTGEIVAKTIAELFNVDLEKEVNTKTMNQIMTVKDLFDSNDNNAFPEFRGTGYNLFNSVTEYADHYKPVRMTDGREGQTIEVVRSDSALFGQGADFKARALELILENTKTCQTIQRKAYSVPEGGSVLDAVLGQYN